MQKDDYIFKPKVNSTPENRDNQTNNFENN